MKEKGIITTVLVGLCIVNGVFLVNLNQKLTNIENIGAISSIEKIQKTFDLSTRILTEVDNIKDQLDQIQKQFMCVDENGDVVDC